MPELPPDLSRLGDALEQAVARAIARRRVQLRAAWALGAVVVALPMAVTAAGLYMGGGERRAPIASPTATAPGADAAGVLNRPVRRGRMQREPRVPARRARLRVAVHPLDLIPPPVGARSARDYQAGVATERVDRRPPFAHRSI